jgi:endonuclease YncB( thermonuclease family)
MKKRMILGILIALIFMMPAALRAEDPRPQHARGDLKSPSSQAQDPGGEAAALSQAQTSPVPSEQARHSDDSGQSSPAPATQVGTYDQLVAAIRQAHEASEARVEQAVEQSKVREAWEIGKLIDEHVLRHKERADYGKQVILRLSQDLPISDTQLYSMLEFARAYPIFPAPGKLSWASYRELLSVNDLAERAGLEEKAKKENWTQDQTREEVKKYKAAKNETPAAPVKEAPLTAQPGKPGTYRIVKAAAGPETGKAVIDLGFSNYYRTSRDLRFKEGAIIEVIPAFPQGASAPSDLIKLSKRTSADLYTYRAWVSRVLDGDTIEAVVDLGFGVRSVQTIRLRGLDAPELVSKEGKEAKDFVEQELRSTETKKQERSLPLASGLSVSPVLIRTVKSDKYDRYLGDVFYMDKAGQQVYLNNRLLEAGHAVRVSE